MEDQMGEEHASQGDVQFAHVGEVGLCGLAGEMDLGKMTSCSGPCWARQAAMCRCKVRSLVAGY